MLQSNEARAPQLLSQRSRACELPVLKPGCLEPVRHSHSNAECYRKSTNDSSVLNEIQNQH